MAVRQEDETPVSGLFEEAGYGNLPSRNSSKTHRGWQGVIP